MPLPRFLVGDAAFGWGKRRAQVVQVSKGATALVAPIPQGGGTDPIRFSVADFRLSPDGAACTCPNGVRSTRCERHGSGEGGSFRFTATDGRDGPLWQHCRDPKAKPTGHRTVYRSDHHELVREAADFNWLPMGRRLLKSRWRIEPTIAWLVHYDGARRTRRLGQAAAQFHLYQACAVRTLWLWLARGAPCAPRPPPEPPLLPSRPLGHAPGTVRVRLRRGSRSRRDAHVVESRHIRPAHGPWRSLDGSIVAGRVSPPPEAP